MPTTIELAIFILGSVLLLMALVNAQFEFLTNKIPKADGPAQRRAAAVLGPVLIVSAIAIYLFKPHSNLATIPIPDCGVIPGQPNIPDPFHTCSAKWSDVERQLGTYKLQLSVYTACVRAAVGSVANARDKAAAQDILDKLAKETQDADKHIQAMEGAHEAGKNLGYVGPC
jgi:hypothetical protein